MSPIIYLHLLILCGIWSQEITGIFANEEIRESSDILLRQKRVISLIPGEDRRVFINRFPFIVRIKLDRRFNCVGSILSLHTVITIAHCVENSAEHYHVVAGAANLDHGIKYNVVNIEKRHVNAPNRLTDGIALLTVNPNFVYGKFINHVELHSAPLLTGTIGTIAGWGCHFRDTEQGTSIPKTLRSIEVPIMAHQACKNIYRPHNIEISDKDICTFHPQKFCGYTDGGAPLIVDGYLAGLHLWSGPRKGKYNPEYPDVFAILQDFEYNQWIRTTIERIEAAFQRHHS